MKKHVLVTGGTGYIGSHTVVELLNEGYQVSIIDNLSNSNLDVLDRIEKIAGKRPDFGKVDLVDKSSTEKYIQSIPKVDAIIHFAAYKAVGESVDEPLKYYHNNLVSLLNVLEIMKEKNIEHLVFSSSCTVYGEPDKLPVTEQTPVKKAMSPYGNTKQIAEEIIEDTTKAVSSIKAIALRYFNPIGAHKSGLIGELPIGVPLNLVPFVTQTGVGLREQLKVFGDDYNTPDGTCIRDYIYVGDLAQAHVKAIERLIQNENKTSYEVFNIGTGTGSSVLEVINSFEKVAERKLNYQIVERRAGDIEKMYAGVDFANNVLGWKSETSLDECLRTAWNWEVNYRKQEK